MKEISFRFFKWFVNARLADNLVKNFSDGIFTMNKNIKRADEELRQKDYVELDERVVSPDISGQNMIE